MAVTKKDMHTLAKLIKKAGDKLAEDKALEEVCLSDLLGLEGLYLVVTNTTGYQDIVIGNMESPDYCSLYADTTNGSRKFPAICEIEKRLDTLISEDATLLKEAGAVFSGTIKKFAEYASACVEAAGKISDMDTLLASISSKVCFGTLLLDNKATSIPKNPILDGDIKRYKGESISIGDSVSGKEIAWLKVGNLFVCDRTILSAISWDQLNELGLIFGKPVVIDDRKYLLRSLTDAEWDQMIDLYGEDNATLHYEKMYSWTQDEDKTHKKYRSLRGYSGARNYIDPYATNHSNGVGFRPALELL